MKKLGLALGGGGARGTAHIGFLQALEDNNIKAAVVTGCSIGSVVGAAYAMGKTPKQLLTYALMLRRRHMVDLDINLFKDCSFLKGKKLERLIRTLFEGIDIKNLKIPYGCIAVDLKNGETVFFKEGDLVTAVKASSAIPVVFPPVEFEGRLLADGGLNNRTPVKEARELGAEVVVAVDILAEATVYEKIDNIITVALRTIDIMGDNIQRNMPKKDTGDIVIKPKLSNISQYKVKDQQAGYDAGYEAGKQNIDKIKELIK